MSEEYYFFLAAVMRVWYLWVADFRLTRAFALEAGSVSQPVQDPRDPPAIPLRPPTTPSQNLGVVTSPNPRMDAYAALNRHRVTEDTAPLSEVQAYFPTSMISSSDRIVKMEVGVEIFL